MRARQKSGRITNEGKIPSVRYGDHWSGLQSPFSSGIQRRHPARTPHPPVNVPACYKTSLSVVL